jgi:small subunit ribosomal protein S6
VKIKEYEAAVVLHPSLSEEQLEAQVAAIQKLIETNGGHDIEIDRWGRRRLAYEIQHVHDGYYVFFRFRSGPETPGPVNHGLRLNEAVIRHIVVIAPPKQEHVEPVVKPVSREEGSFRPPAPPSSRPEPAPVPEASPTE